MSWTIEHICKVSASSPLWLLRRRFFNIFSKIYPLCCHGNQSNSAIWTKFIWITEDYSRNISVEKILNICSETAKIANFHFSYYKSMETISCHSNRSSYPVGTKNILIRSPHLQMLYVKYGKNRLHGFRGDLIWKCWRMTDTWRMPAYNTSSPMSLLLRWAKNLNSVVLLYMSCHMTKPTKWRVRPVMTKFSLSICPVWSETLLCAQWVTKDPRFLYADSEGSGQTGWMARLIWVFAGRTCHFLGFVVRWLTLQHNVSRNGKQGCHWSDCSLSQWGDPNAYP